MPYRFAIVALLVSAVLPAHASVPSSSAPAPAPAPALDPPSLELVEASIQACHQTAANPTAVIAWAQAHHAVALTAPATIGFYANGPGGRAWSLATAHNQLILAHRASSEVCAVYAAHANPEELRTFFTVLMHQLQARGGKVSLGLVTDTPSPYGRHKLLSFETDTPTAASVTVVLTYAQPGGPYRAAIWLRVMPLGVASYLKPYFHELPKSRP